MTCEQQSRLKYKWIVHKDHSEVYMEHPAPVTVEVCHWAIQDIYYIRPFYQDQEM